MEILRHHFDTIDSTNTWVKHHANELSHDKITLVTADEQTGGRGRFKRRWESPKGLNIYATYGLFLEKHRTDIGNLPQVLALSAIQLLSKKDFHPFLKWPNDVMLSGKKMAGILCETVPVSDYFCIALGIGLNVNMPEELLKQIDRPATSLMVESNRLYDVDMILKELTDKFISNLQVFIEEGFMPFFSDYVLSLIHQPDDLIRFHDNRVIWEGTFCGISKEGALILKLPSGIKRTFNAGEILV